MASSWLALALTSKLSYSQLKLNVEQLERLLPLLSGSCQNFLLQSHVSLAFEMYTSLLRSGSTKTSIFELVDRFFVFADGLVFLLFDASVTRKIVNELVKLPTLVSNAFGVDRQLTEVKWALVRAIVVFRFFSHRLDTFLKPKSWLNVYCMEHLCLFYKDDAFIMKAFCTALLSIIKLDGFDLGQDLKEMSSYRRKIVMESLVLNCRDAMELKSLLGTNVTSMENELLYILINPRSRLDVSLISESSSSNTSPLATLIGFISRCNGGNEVLRRIWRQVVRHWSDPKIVESVIHTEIVHLSHVALTVFAHLDLETLMEHKLEIVEPFMKGLPNHLNSTDITNVLRAKLMTQLITCTMSFDQGDHEDAKKNFISDLESADNSDQNVAADLRELLQQCRDTSKLWYKPEIKFSRDKDEDQDGRHNKDDRNELDEKNKDDVLDEDDDSDLEPIESIVAAPSSSSIRFLRQFLDTFPECKSHESIRSALTSLPMLIRHQLALDHPQVGLDVMSMVFNYENEYDDNELERARKEDLVALIHYDCQETRINTKHLCQLFNGSQLQAHRKCLILDVISTAAKETCSLVALQDLTKIIFEHLLIDHLAIEQQPLTVRIPFILCLSQQLGLLPEVMVKYEHMTKLVEALCHVRSLDSGVKQAIKFALSSLVSRIEHVQKRQGDQRLKSNLLEISQIVSANSSLKSSINMGS